MQTVPRRISLITQTKEVLIEGIARHRWQGQLPGERRLCRELQVSRWTLRAALQGLAEDRYIRISHGRSCQIMARPLRARAGAGSWRVGYIYQDSISTLRPFIALMLDGIRADLQRMGGELDVYQGRKYYGKNCTQALDELVEQNPHRCWLLAFSTRPMQRWFEARRLPVIVGGSLHSGVRLPSINVDYRAVGRHAGGVLLARGHRRVAMLASNRGIAVGGFPGGEEIELGLREAFAASGDAPEPQVIFQNGDPLRIAKILDRLRHLAEPPTALLIADSPTLLTTMTHLAQRGMASPRDLSVVVAEDEPYYRQILPELTHYEWPLEEFTKHWRRVLQQARDQTLSPDLCVRIIPRFIPGGTLANWSGKQIS